MAYIGDYNRDIKGDKKSIDYSSHGGSVYVGVGRLLGN